MAKHAGGRPRGVHSEMNPAVIEARPEFTCRKCGHHERTKYRDVVRKKIAGAHPDGRIYTEVIWRDCDCAACGQKHRVRFYLDTRGSLVPRDLPAED
jgi:hypothetical protein